MDVNEELKLGGGFGGQGVRGRVWVVRVDVIEELKFLGKFTKKKIFFFFWGGGSGGGWGRVDWGVRVHVNEELNFL